jgi:hypothetical protein
VRWAAAPESAAPFPCLIEKSRDHGAMAIVSPQANYGTAHTCFKYVSGDPISCLDIFSSSRVVVGTAAGRLLFVQLPAAGTAGDEEAIDLSEAIEGLIFELFPLN